MPVTSLTACSSTPNAAAASKSPQHVTMTRWELSEIDERGECAGRAGERHLAVAQYGPAVDVPECDGRSGAERPH